MLGCQRLHLLLLALLVEEVLAKEAEIVEFAVEQLGLLVGEGEDLAVHEVFQGADLVEEVVVGGELVGVNLLAVVLQELLVEHVLLVSCLEGQR